MCNRIEAIFIILLKVLLDRREHNKKPFELVQKLFEGMTIGKTFLDFFPGNNDIIYYSPKYFGVRGLVLEDWY